MILDTQVLIQPKLMFYRKLINDKLLHQPNIMFDSNLIYGWTIVRLIQVCSTNSLIFGVCSVPAA